MKIVVASDKFKESISAKDACLSIADGIRDVLPNARIRCIPMADGGEGTVESLVVATGGRFIETPVSGPVGERVIARWGMLGDMSFTAVMEMASASGLALVPSHLRNPLLTSTYGTGELIAHIMETSPVDRIIIGAGGSATVDGGAGAASALGYQFLDELRQPLKKQIAGGDLGQIAEIVTSPLRERMSEINMLVACDVVNVLCGPAGAATVFGPQKGASARQVKALNRNLAHLAFLVQRALNVDIHALDGAGAAGGLAGGLVAFCGAKLCRGIDLVMEIVRFRERIRDADLIITGEGRLDEQSMMGKVIAGVGHAGRKAGVPVVALVGSLGPGAEKTREVLDDYMVITPRGMLSSAFSQTSHLLRAAAANLIRKRGE